MRIRCLLAPLLCLLVPAFALAQSEHIHPVLLKKGASLPYRWAVAVIRDGGQRGGERPCLLAQVVDTEAPSGAGSFGNTKELKVCSALPSSGPPDIVSLNVGSHGKEITVYGLVFIPAVRVAVLDFARAGELTMSLSELNKIQRKNAGGVRSARYGSFTLSSNDCLRQISGFDQFGGEIYRGPANDCGNIRD
jgi:hypothetical protein